VVGLSEPSMGRRARALPTESLVRVGVVAGAFVVWEIGARLANSPLMPPLGMTISRVIEDLRSGLLLEHAATTLTRGFLGFALALILGVSLGILMARSWTVEAVFEPLLAATFPVPRLALYPIFILLFGFGARAQVALVALECMYPIAYTTYSGARSIGRDLIWTARNLGVSRLTLLSSVVLPATLPSIMAGIRTALPIMLVVITVTEMIGTSQGLGFLIRSASTNFEPDGALAIILVLAVLGFAFDRIVVVLTRLLVFWERGVQQS
jgi:ABC-type nitrate/sulfonate/bicarbonate transport system permease component